MIKRQYTLYLENVPGALAKLTGGLSKANVNIEGISVAESTDTALIQLIVDKDSAAKRVLEKSRIPHTIQNVSVIVLPHRPGVLAQLASKISKEKVVINYIYATAADSDSACCIVISADDLMKVEKIAVSLK